ncbi:hypothetical protein KXD40_002185 [Peronospora effusa]|nr:hypothetical protein KXD40_002185 [Peronospora effusa]
MLEHAVDCNETNWLLLPNGERLQVTKKGTVTLIGIAEGKELELNLSNLYIAPLLSRNLLLFGISAKQGCRIESRHGSMIIAKGSPSQVVFYLKLEANVLVSSDSHLHRNVKKEP